MSETEFKGPRMIVTSKGEMIVGKISVKFTDNLKRNNKIIITHPMIILLGYHPSGSGFTLNMQPFPLGIQEIASRESLKTMSIELDAKESISDILKVDERVENQYNSAAMKYFEGMTIEVPKPTRLDDLRKN